MKITGSSEMARMQMMQRRAIATRDALDIAAKEMTTGEKASRFKATGGNLTRLFSLERSIDRNAVFSETVALTELRLDVMQSGLGLLLAPAEELAMSLSSAVGLGDIAAGRVHAATARREFAATVGMLNTQVAGQSLFAGTATDGPALADAAAILADLDAIAAGALDAAAAIAAIDAYFAPAGAFLATRYVGGGADLTPVEIGEGQRLDYGVRADADEFVALLRSQALAAVVDGGAFAGDVDAQLALLDEAGRGMLAAKEGILALRARVGVDQEAVERARAQRIAERDVLEIARAKIVAVDPLEAASTFQMLESQLEAVYTVTARLANLRFVNFMRY